jgi:hypothetical protein
LIAINGYLCSVKDKFVVYLSAIEHGLFAAATDGL